MTEKKPGPVKGKKYQQLIRTPIASRIHQARKDRGITQDELAKRSLLSKRMIARYEENYTGSIKSIIRIAKALDVRWGILSRHCHGRAVHGRCGALYARIFQQAPGAAARRA